MEDKIQGSQFSHSQQQNGVQSINKCNNNESNFQKKNEINTDINSDKYQIIVYYFDFQCLPTTYDDSQVFNAEKVANTQPPHAIQQIRKEEDKQQLLKTSQMKRTKRAFNLYKSLIDSDCEIIRLTTDNQIETMQSTQVGLNQSASQHSQINSQGSQINQHSDFQQSQSQVNEQSSQDRKIFNGELLANNSHESKFEKSQNQQIKQGDSINKCIDQQNREGEIKFQVLEFQNPYYQNGVLEVNSSDKQNNSNRSSKKRLVIYNNQLIQVEQRKNRKKIIISTDLGGTLCGIPEATLEFNKYWIKYFWFDKQCKLIYNSGRGIHPFNLMMKRESLLLPDYYIGRCGSFIYLKDYTKGFLFQDKQWMHELSKIWQPKIIQDKLESLSSWLKYKVRNEPEVWSLRYNSEINVYYEHEEEFKQAEKEINQQGVEFNTIVREKQNLMHIEIVPSITDKGFALEYLLHKVYYPCFQNINEQLKYQEKMEGKIRQQEEQQRCQKAIIESIQNKVIQIKSNSFDYKDVQINKKADDIIIAAFGDTMNDDGMLKLANTSICVSNSEQQLIQWANSQQQQSHPQLLVSEHANGYALLDFIKQYIN